MTVSTQTAKVVYQGNGSTTQFTVPFRFIREADLRVVVCSEDGTENELTLTTDYTVFGAGQATGGSCTLNQAPAGDQTLAILRDPDLVQETDYQENDAFPAETHEAALDLLTMIAQTNREHINRAIKLPLSSSLTGLTMPMPEAGRALVWNQGEHGLVNGPAADEIENAQAAATTAVASAAAAQAAQTAAETARDETEALAGAEASIIVYDGSESGLPAENVQDAIDEEVADRVIEDRLIRHQMELGFFQLAENQAMTDIELVNKRMDTFEDATNINAAASSGYEHDDTNDLVRPLPGSPTHTPGLSAATHADVKGSITQFTVDTADTSGHFDAAAGAKVQAGCRMVISGTDYSITSITNDGDATNEVEFNGTLAAGTYSVTGIYGTVYEDSALTLSQYVSGYGSNVLGSATLTTNTGSNVGTPANLNDGNTTSYHQPNGNYEDSYQLTMTFPSAVSLGKIRQYWDGSVSSMETFDLLASATGVFGGEEETLVSGGDFNLTGAGWFEVEFDPPSEPCTYYRLDCKSTVNTTNNYRPYCHEFEAMELTIDAPTNQFYTVALPAIDNAAIADIVSAAVTGDADSQTLVFAVSFDGGSTLVAWDGDSWESVSLDSETGWMTEATIEGIADADWPTPTGNIGVYVGLKTASASANPSLSGFTLNVVGRTADMELVMAPVDTTGGPDSARVFAVLKDGDAITLDTDLKAWVSRNGGSSWDQISLDKVADFLTDRYTVEGTLESFTHADGGTDEAVFKLTSHNHKDFELRFLSQGVGV